MKDKDEFCLNGVEVYTFSRKLTFATGRNALFPRMIELITIVTALLEPVSTASATTEYAIFLDRSTFRAYGTNCQLNIWWRELI